MKIVCYYIDTNRLKAIIFAITVLATGSCTAKEEKLSDSVQFIKQKRQTNTGQAAKTNTLTIEGNLTVDGVVNADDFDVSGEISVDNDAIFNDDLTVGGAATFNNNVEVKKSFKLKDGTSMVGFQIAITEDCDSSHKDKVTKPDTCTISGSWDFCSLSKYYVDASKGNPDNVTCRTYQISSDTGSWAIDALFDHNTSGACAGICINFSNQANSLENGLITVTKQSSLKKN